MGSGVSRLRAARLKPSWSRFLRHIPEWAFGVNLRLLRMRPKIRRPLCLKCGMCVEACPKEAITEQAGTGYPLIDKAKCIDCFCCLESCQQSAIATQYCLGNFLSITSKKRRTEHQP
jgi:ferredoxin